ncbi:unnamed protein product [Didymodactylos carnosus]|uniref:NAD(P)(+)--arginine ADP-ribosyltransferase n=1 Tax=Didymodactylos carnosus TaxID=1234261 RepID=A0A8S2IPB7_9BILA|nr:unnamed protein product [Didymodactylos carnosus]CAF3770325.1 unnamed protein product [Didymodactylos carnosus]
MLSPLSSNNDDNDSDLIDLLYNLCKENEIEKVRSLLPFIGNINIINKIQNSTGSTCLHVACYYGHRHMVEILLEYGALHSIRNLRHNLTPYEEAQTDDIKQLFLEHRKLFSNNDYHYIEWSVVGDDLLGKRREFREAIDLYKTYDNHRLISKLLAEVIHYYLNEYLVTQILNKNLALYILEYVDKKKTFSSNYRLVNCLIHIVTLLIYHPNLPQYRYQGVCYYGMKITQNDLDQYQVDQHILNRAFLPTSIDRQVAEMFASEGQQSQMRYTPQDHCALQYSCLCQYLIKQKSTAINIESLSTRPDEKEILIIPFTVFKVITIKRNYLDDSTASISIEIQLEECEDPDDNKNEPESCPNIFNRSSWNARPYISRESLTTLPATHIVIRQLTDLPSIINQQDCIKTIQDLQDFQIDKRGWADIGYSFLICNDNDDQQQIYRGRGWTYVGAHCVDYNFKSLGKDKFRF